MEKKHRHRWGFVSDISPKICLICGIIKQPAEYYSKALLYSDGNSLVYTFNSKNLHIFRHSWWSSGLYFYQDSIIYKPFDKMPPKIRLALWLHLMDGFNWRPELVSKIIPIWRSYDKDER